MSPLPDRKRPRLTQPARRLGASLLRLAGHGAWRVLHPGTRGPFLAAERPVALARLYYEAGDGWRAPLLRMDTVPGAAGEPVLLAHGLGLSSASLRYGDGHSLAGSLRAAGFAVYLLAHRADGDALPPHPGARADIDFDRILERDLPAAVDRVLDDCGMPRLHWVGHGLGGQLGLCWAAADPDRAASVAALGAPFEFGGGSAARRAARALQLLPARWRIPLRAAGRLAAPLLDDGDLGSTAGWAGSDGGQVRGVLTYATEDLPLGLLRQVLSWQRHGRLTSVDGTLDWTETLGRGVAPLLLMAGEEDRTCPPEASVVALERWGGAAELRRIAGVGHLDLVLGAQAEERVFQPLVAWLMHHRKKAWLDASSSATVGPLEDDPWLRVANGSPETS